MSPYDVDKVFWLIGSGKFNNHPHVGSIGRKKTPFIAEFNAMQSPAARWTLREKAAQRP